MTLSLLLSCGSEDLRKDEQTIRLGATWGLAPLELDLFPSGSSASLHTLLYTPTGQYIERAEVNGTSVLLSLKTDSPKSAEELAQAFRLKSLLSSRAVDPQTIRVTFSSEEAASRVAGLAFGGFALGPFRVRSENETSAVLERKTPHPIQTISVEEMTAQEEWRRFLGGQLDILPRASARHRKYLESMKSVKVIDYPASHDLALYFNLNSEHFSSRDRRQCVADSVDLSALTRIVTGRETTNAVGMSHAPRHCAQVFETPVSLVFLDTDDEFRNVADVLHYQLAEADIVVERVPVSIEGLVATGESGSFDLMLMPVPLNARRFTRFLSNKHPTSTGFIGYNSHAYDAAFDASDIVAMEKALLEDLPILLLYQQTFFAATRSELCTSGALNPTEWQWLASVHPCEEVATP